MDPEVGKKMKYAGTAWDFNNARKVEVPDGEYLVVDEIVDERGSGVIVVVPNPHEDVEVLVDSNDVYKYRMVHDPDFARREEAMQQFLMEDR